MFYVISQFVFENRKGEKEAWSKFERVNLKVVVQTQKEGMDFITEGRRHNDAEAIGAGEANGAYRRYFVIKRR